MILPGLEAQHLAIYIGWLLHRTWGGIVAGALFVLPSAFILWALTWLYATCGNVGWVAAVFDGLKPAPLAMATLGAFITTWTTFLPCFLYIFLGAPHIEQMRGNVKLTAALSAITAAVVGVVLNLAVWFGLHVLFPANLPVNWFGVVVCIVAFTGMVKWKRDIIPVVLGTGVLGVIYKLAVLKLAA